LTRQEAYLKGVKLLSATRDHNHCEFCGSRFSLRPGDLSEGYTTENQYRWICTLCFQDFRASFEWPVINEITKDFGSYQSTEIVEVLKAYPKQME
jgi:hypothetical protein